MNYFSSQLYSTMEKTQLLRIELGEALTTEFASYWMGRKLSNQVPLEIDIDPVEQKDSGTSAFALPEEILVTTADTTLSSDLVRVFLKQLVDFIRHTLKNKNPQQIRITIDDTTYEINTGTITYTMIENLTSHHNY
jgi:hypothetical protein